MKSSVMLTWHLHSMQILRTNCLPESSTCTCRAKFVALLAALTKDELRGTDIIEEAEKGAKPEDTEKKADAKKEEPKEDEAKDKEMKDAQETAEPKEDTKDDQEKDKDVSKEADAGQADHAEDKTEAKEGDKAEAKEEDKAEKKADDTKASDRKPENEPNTQETAQEGGKTEDTTDVPDQSAEPEKA